MATIKWGVYLRQPDWSVEQLQTFVEKAEALDYYGIYTNDHLTGFDKQREGKEPYLEAWTFITAVLMWSKKLRGGHTVLCQSFRNPALLAKMTATLDVLSNGRFELFLGAGWKEDEYLAYGFPFPTPGERLKQLEEYVTIIRNLLDPKIDTWDFEGKFWTLKNSRNFPKPITQPFPIHLGGKGPRFVKLAAKIADGFNTGGYFHKSIEVFQRFDNEVTKLGLKPSDKIKSFFGGIRIFKREEDMQEYAKELRKNDERFADQTVEELVKTQPWGTPEILAEKIRTFIDATNVHFLIFAYRSNYGDPLEVFKDEVLPLI